MGKIVIVRHSDPQEERSKKTLDLCQTIISIYLELVKHVQYEFDVTPS